MSPNAESRHPAGRLELRRSLRRLLTAAGCRRVAALARLTAREAVRSRVLVGAVALTTLFALGSLLWPQKSDARRVIVVQRLCYGALTFFGLIIAAFVGGATLHRDIASKRIYSVATKPLSRLEIVLGKTAGLFALLFIYLCFGGGITWAVTHIANLRKTFEGGSYTLEVIAPAAQLQTDDPSIEDERRRLRQGQVLEAIGKTERGYRARIAGRHTEIAGTIEESAVRLRERTLQPQRVAEPTELSARCRGETRVDAGELKLWIGSLAERETWVYSLPDLRTLPGDESIKVRMIVGHLRHEPVRDVDRSRHEPPNILFEFYDPRRHTGPRDSSLRREVDFVFSEKDSRRDPDAWPPYDYYHGVLALPRELVEGGALAAEVVDVTPDYPAGGRIFFSERKQPQWRIGAVDAARLPRGRQTLRACFLVQARSGYDLLDDAPVTAVIRNPATGEQVERRLRLRQKTVSYVRFPRELVDPDQGVELRITDIPSNADIGFFVNEPPVYLILEPGSFWASAARSVAMIFFELCIFAVIAVAASTVLSAPVAILLTVVIALAGGVKELLLTELSGEISAPTAAALEKLTPTAQAWRWIEYLYQRFLVWIAPGFHRFSTTEFVNRSWAVPWSALLNAALFAIGYGAVCFCIGYLFFSAREFE
ncbi:MAG: ABC transporter permease [Planctomycetota bacterium]